jgi:hypothetical protein
VAWEVAYNDDTRKSAYRLPRRFETFDEAWEITRKVIDATGMEKAPKFELTFYQVE